MTGEGTPQPAFRSPRCVVGRHDHCRDHTPCDDGVPGVRRLMCDCTCHLPVAVTPDTDR